MLFIGSTVYHLHPTNEYETPIPNTTEQKREALKLLKTVNRTSTSSEYRLPSGRLLTVGKFDFDICSSPLDVEEEKEKKETVEKKKQIGDNDCSVCLKQVMNYQWRDQLNVFCSEGEQWFTKYSTDELVCFSCADKHNDICPRCNVRLMEAVPVGYGFYTLLQQTGQDKNYPEWNAKAYDSEIVCVGCGNLSKHSKIYPTAFQKLKGLGSSTATTTNSTSPVNTSNIPLSPTSPSPDRYYEYSSDGSPNEKLIISGKRKRKAKIMFGSNELTPDHKKPRVD